MTNSARMQLAAIAPSVGTIQIGSCAVLTGELGNGLICNPIFSPQHVRGHILSAPKIGLDQAGRSRSDAGVLGQRFAVIDDDLTTAYRIGAGAMMFSIWARIYDDIFAADGFSETVDQVRSRQRTTDTDKAVKLISYEMVDAFVRSGGLIGSGPKSMNAKDCLIPPFSLSRIQARRKSSAIIVGIKFWMRLRTRERLHPFSIPLLAGEPRRVIDI
jgi:hypothetical protein